MLLPSSEHRAECVGIEEVMSRAQAGHGVLSWRRRGELYMLMARDICQSAGGRSSISTDDIKLSFHALPSGFW